MIRTTFNLLRQTRAETARGSQFTLIKNSAPQSIVNRDGQMPGGRPQLRSCWEVYKCENGRPVLGMRWTRDQKEEMDSALRGRRTLISRPDSLVAV